MHIKHQKNVIVIGAGFSGIAAATALADKGFNVDVLEKNDSPGGRARQWKAEGFTFDMGPSWYWMPDVFERYFSNFNKTADEYYTLQRLNPSYRIFFDQGNQFDMPVGKNELYRLFESIEKGSAEKLKLFLQDASAKYHLGMNKWVHKPGLSLTEYMRFEIVKGVTRLGLFRSMKKHVRRYFKHPYLIQLMEFPVLFLGAMPNKIPSLYSLMNYADMELGTWYPRGGMISIVNGMVKLAKEKGVKFRYDAEVTSIYCNERSVTGVAVGEEAYRADVLVAGADYHHVEQKLLPSAYRRYSKKYWDTRVMAPSCLIFYLGVNKKLDHLEHHNLFFDEQMALHAFEMYESPQWPTKPLFYLSCTSKTDQSVAPEGCENLFVLIPVAPGLVDDEAIREKYYNLVINRLEQKTKQKIKDFIVYRKDYAHNDFVADYNAYKGNAYGLANTLKQTAVLKPSIRSKKLNNLFYTGQLTVPGPGVPPALISGQLVACEVEKHFA